MTALLDILKIYAVIIISYLKVFLLPWSNLHRVDYITSSLRFLWWKSNLETGTVINPLLIINHMNPQRHPAKLLWSFCIVIRTGGDHAHPVCRPKRLPLEHLQQRRAAEAGGLQRAASTSNPTLCRLRHHPPAGWPFYPPATCFGSFLGYSM